MSFKKSENIVKKNSKKWETNLTIFEKSKTRRRDIKNIEKPLSELCKIPKQCFVIGRYNEMAKQEKSKKGRIKMIAGELLELWQKMNFPSIKMTSIERKIDKLLQVYSTFIKFPSGKYNIDTFENVFDITNENGIWLGTEDKKLYQLQKKTKGKVGYTTAKEVDIHPSKAALVNNSKKIALSTQKNKINISASSNEENAPQYELNEDEFKPHKRFKRTAKCSTTSAVALIETAKVSTRKATTICKQLSKSGIDIATPTQSGIYRAAIKSAERLEQNYINSLKDEIWCLHFDGKKIGKKEYQAVVLTNELKEIRLAVMVLDNGKSLTIYKGIEEILDKFQLWKSINMIICDTTNVNTGRMNGVVSLLQANFERQHLPPPQYIGCQHHVLDLVLKHVMNELLVGKSTSPNISYEIFTELINDYEKLKSKFIQTNDQLPIKRIKWRDDMQFLYELGQIFKYYEQHEKFPHIKFRPLPSLSNARWNSRAILAILTFILIPNKREELLKVCKFICGAWYDVWFSDHRYRGNDFNNLQKSVEPFRNAHKCFHKHWVNEESRIPNIKRSNICAERAIKVIQDINPLCKNERTLNLKFLTSNNNTN